MSVLFREYSRVYALKILPIFIFFGMATIAFLEYTSAQSAKFVNLIDGRQNAFVEISRSNNQRSCYGSDTNAEKLSKCLTKNLRSEVDKAFAIYFWIAKNISYDVEGVKSCNKSGRGCPNQSSDIVLKRKTAICDGYARLFREMTYFAGLTSRKVNGFADSERRPEADGRPNHAWNVIRINDVWYPLDVTWDAGFVDSKSGKFFQNDDAFTYFLNDPASFARHHLAVDPKWQLSGRSSSIGFFDSSSSENSSSLSEDILFVWHGLIDNPSMPALFIILCIIVEHFLIPDVFYFLFYAMCSWIILATVPVWLVEKLISVCLFISAPFRFLYRKLSE